MFADWKRYTRLPCAEKAEPGQPGSQSPQAPAVASLSRPPTRFTDAGSGISAAETFNGVSQLARVRDKMLKMLKKIIIF
jgi:hypothetical protein